MVAGRPLSRTEPNEMEGRRQNCSHKCLTGQQLIQLRNCDYFNGGPMDAHEAVPMRNKGTTE